MTDKNPFEGMDENDLRRAGAESVRKVARVFAERISPDDAWRLLLAASLEVMLIEMGDAGTAETLRDIASGVESGTEARLLN